MAPNAANSEAGTLEGSAILKTPFQVSSAAQPTPQSSTEQTTAQPTAAMISQPQADTQPCNTAVSDPNVLEAATPAKASVPASTAADLTCERSIAEAPTQHVAANTAVNAGSEEPIVMRSAEEHNTSSIIELSPQLVTAKLTKLSSPADGSAEVRHAKYSTASVRRALQSYRQAREQVCLWHSAFVMYLSPSAKLPGPSGHGR